MKSNPWRMLISMTHPLLRDAITAHRRGDRREARRLLGQVVQEEPDNLDAWWLLHSVLDDSEQKIQCLRHVLRLDPGHVQARNLLNDAQIRLARQTPAKGYRYPILEAHDTADGKSIINVELGESPALVTSTLPSRGPADAMVLSLAIGISICALLGSFVLIAGGMAPFALGVDSSGQESTLQPLIFDAPACSASQDNQATIVFINNSGSVVEVFQASDQERLSLFVIQPQEQFTYSIEGSSDSARFIALTTDGTRSEGRVSVQVPIGNVCRIPIR